jgi:hypothetical protein
MYNGYNTNPVFDMFNSNNRGKAAKHNANKEPEIRTSRQFEPQVKFNDKMRLNTELQHFNCFKAINHTTGIRLPAARRLLLTTCICI